MNINEYYTTPSDEVFNDIQESAIKVWAKYDNTYGYATEKITHVRDLRNYKDNAWSIVAMFDFENKLELYRYLTNEEAKKKVGAFIAEENDAIERLKLQGINLF